jgi:hypothetical protein
MVDETSEFVLIDGDRQVHEVGGLLSDDSLPVVIRAGGTYWVCTRDELLLIVEGANPNARLSEVMFEFRPAMVTHVATIVPPLRRVVVIDGSEVTAVSVAGRLERDLTTTETEEESEAEPSAPVTEVRAAPSRPWSRRRQKRQTRQKQQQQLESRDVPADLGPSRGLPEESETETEPWHLETRFPREVTVGSVTSLTVDLTRLPGSEPEVSALPVSLAAGTKVGVLVQARRGFEVVGPSEGVVEASEQALPIRFQLRALEVGQGQVRILFFVESTALGAITLEPAILGEGASAATTPVPASTVMSALDVGAARPDLELVILEESSDGRPAYSIRVTSETLGYHLREFGPIVLRTDARSYFADLFAEIEVLDLVTPEDRTRAQALLEAKGDALFRDLIPEQLGEELWNARDRITRIRIDSEEPHIPWELIRLSGRDENGNVVAGRFLCEYEMTRWVLGPGLHDELGLTSFGIVVPSDSELASTQEEKTFLAGLAGPGRSVTEVPATFLDLMAAFSEGRHDVWHFSGHGVVKADQDPNQFAIHLTDNHRFTPNEISGPRANVGRPAPLIFLNACQVGQGGMSLTGLGGWAQQFLEVGASGFVGAMWNVHDNPARDFAKAFYMRLLEGDTIGAAALSAREEIKRYQDATWLAYTVYGHPSAAVASIGDQP